MGSSAHRLLVRLQQHRVPQLLAPRVVVRLPVPRLGGGPLPRGIYALRKGGPIHFQATPRQEPPSCI